VLLALGNAQMGGPLTKSLGLAAETARDMAYKLLYDATEKEGSVPLG
jgi:hypothetical protein